VEIEGIDLNTCAGTHVRSTAELETVELLGSEPARGGTRLLFVAGGRGRRRLRHHEARNARLRSLLGGADDELAGLVETKLAQAKEAGRRERALERQLAEEVAGTLAAVGDTVVARHFDGLGMAFLQQLARAFASRAPAAVALLTATVTDGALFVIVAGDDARIDVTETGAEVAAILGGKGGGKGRLFQGKSAGVERRDEATMRLQAALQV